MHLQRQDQEIVIPYSRQTPRPVPESLYLFGSVAARTLPKRTAGLWQFGRISPGEFHDSEFESSQEMAPQQFLAGITGGRATSSVVKRNMSYLKATLILVNIAAIRLQERPSKLHPYQRF